MPSLIALPQRRPSASESTAHSLIQPQKRLYISPVRHGEGHTSQPADGASVGFLTRGGTTS